jgi:hypothetical protein
VAKKISREKVDGLSPYDKAKVRSAIRQVWHRSHPRRLCEQRSTDAKGYRFCEECGKRVPKVQIDHTIPFGDILSPGAIERMFCPSTGLKAMCPKCHKIKTKEDKEKGLC